MATIDMRRKHSLERDDVRSRAEELARDMQRKLGIQWRWDADSIKFDTPSGAAKGVTGEVSVGASEVRIQIDLPFLLRAIKGKIEGKVKDKVDALIGSA